MQFARLFSPTIATSISGVAKVVRRYYLDTTQSISGRQEASRRAHPPLGGRPRCSPRWRCQQPHPNLDGCLGGWSSFRHQLSQEDVNCSLAIIFLMRTTCTYFETNLPFQYTFQQKMYNCTYIVVKLKVSKVFLMGSLPFTLPLCYDIASSASSPFVIDG